MFNKFKRLSNLKRFELLKPSNSSLILFLNSYFLPRTYNWACIGFDSIDCGKYKHAVRWIIST